MVLLLLNFKAYILCQQQRIPEAESQSSAYKQNISDFVLLCGWKLSAEIAEFVDLVMLRVKSGPGH